MTEQLELFTAQRTPFGGRQANETVMQLQNRLVALRGWIEARKTRREVEHGRQQFFALENEIYRKVVDPKALVELKREILRTRKALNKL